MEALTAAFMEALVAPPTAVTARGTDPATTAAGMLLPTVRNWTAARTVWESRVPWVPWGIGCAGTGAAAAGLARARASEESMITGMVAVAAAASCLPPVVCSPPVVEGRGGVMDAYLKFSLQYGANDDDVSRVTRREFTPKCGQVGFVPPHVPPHLPQDLHGLAQYVGTFECE